MKKLLSILFLVAAVSACDQTRTSVDPVTAESFGDTNHLGGIRPR